jgi:predicted alpha/beta-fold hydrolase
MTHDVPLFEPHPLIRGGHAQTIVGRYLPARNQVLDAEEAVLTLPDGDSLVVLDSVPQNWSQGDPCALLVHGLAGCARAPYMTRVAYRCVRMGVRAVRMNLRGAGDGFGRARGIYHGGRTEDLRAVVDWIASRTPESPIALVGFSLGGNLVLKIAAEARDWPLPGLDCVLAANPPLDLAACCEHIRLPRNRLYDWNFVRLLQSEVRRLHARYPDLGPCDLSSARTLYDFDDVYTAPRNGFAGARDYYARSSAGPLLSRISVPGLVIHSEDDPFIPAEAIRRASFPPDLALELIPAGGHLGYISRAPWDGDHRWLDARLAAWLATRWQRTHERTQPSPGASLGRNSIGG